MNIFNTIQLIAETGSTNQKRDILIQNKDSDMLKAAFLYAENKRFNYYIKVDDIETGLTESADARELDLSDFDTLNDLINRKVTGNAARELVANQLTKLTIGSQIIFKRIINGDLKCGCGTAIANKVWSNLIPEYPMMLCDKFNEKTEKYLEKSLQKDDKLYVQKKLDGSRLVVKVDDSGNVTYHSRNGSELNLFGRFDKFFEKYINTIFDGELLVKTDTGILDRKTGNGNYNRAVRGTLTVEQSKLFYLELWDMIPSEEFNHGQGTVQYKDRYSDLIMCDFDTDSISIAETKIVTTMPEVFAFYDTMRLQGEEGIIVKVSSAFWEDKRSKNCIKIKAEETCDALVTGFEPGTGKNTGKIGALNCESSCGKLKFNVGTGLNDFDREKNPDEYIGKIIEVCYNSVIGSKGKETKSLFLPVFKSIRLDKVVANTLAELK